jgi:D-3-phosphoglycerate dehydrogenase
VHRQPAVRTAAGRRHPHLGASTTEAQDRAGTDVAASVRLALAGEFVPDAVNVGAGVVSEEVAPWLELVRKLGLLVGALATEPPSSLSVRVCGELASEDVEVLRLRRCAGCSRRSPTSR